MYNNIGDAMKVLKEIKKGTYLYYLCECPYCHNTKEIRKDHYKERKSDNCGCQRHNDARNGHHNKIYNIHQAIKQRCLNPNQKYYNRYGGRGIKICDEWLDYKTFKKWCMENGYKEGLDIDRIDNNGNYEPSNCRFISHIQNCNNRHNSLHHMINGKMMTTREVAETYGFSIDCIHSRYRMGRRNEQLIEPKYKNIIKNSNTN